MTDILASAALVAALATGIILHLQVHHLGVYDDAALWGAHEAVGLGCMAAVIGHGLQHRWWFVSYRHLKPGRRWPTTLFLLAAVVVAATGVALMAGSHSNAVSLTHYAGGIVFALLAVWHVGRRWRMFVKLF